MLLKVNKTFNGSKIYLFVSYFALEKYAPCDRRFLDIIQSNSYILVSSPPTASPVDSPSKTNMTQAATLETLLFKATNPSNKLEDVNTIKQFCDLVNKTNTNGNNEGSVAACRILAHKIQSPQVNSFSR